MGGIYNLYEMAINKLPKAKNISEILCAHARNITQEEDYRKKYSNKPSNEIQSLLNILSKKKENPFKKIRLDLSSTYLRRSDLEYAQLQGANLDKAQLQEANLMFAQLQGADLIEAQLQEANLWSVKLQGANLRDAQLQGVKLRDAQLQGTYLIGAQLQGADLSQAQLQEAHLWSVMQGANLMFAQLQGANLRGAQLQGADLIGVQLQGANLHNVQLQGANLHNVQLQGADLYEAQLQGAFTELIPIHSSSGFEKRIESRIDKTTELRNVIFAGGIDERYGEYLKEKLSPMVEKKFLTQERIDFLLKELEPHIGKPPNCTPPYRSYTRNT